MRQLAHLSEVDELLLAGDLPKVSEQAGGS
jgi:hypothetical protein